MPDSLDWDFWLGPTPRSITSRQRCHYEFRWWYDYSGGKMTDWGAHHNDIAQWGLGMDGGGPIEVVPRGKPDPGAERYNCHPHFKVTYTYAERHEPSPCMSDGKNGVKFEGEDGWIFVDRGKIEASDQKLLDEPLPSDATRLYNSKSHMTNFLDCIKDRQRPICDVEVGHRSVSVCHLGTSRSGSTASISSGTPPRSDSAAMRSPMRCSAARCAPWKLEV